MVAVTIVGAERTGTGPVATVAVFLLLSNTEALLTRMAVSKMMVVNTTRGTQRPVCNKKPLFI
jgi:hypothetical protein